MHSASISSPECPKGEWPRSWASAIASARSSFKDNARAIVRLIDAGPRHWRIVGHAGIIGCSFGFASPELARGRLAGVLNFSDCAQLYREQMRGRPKKKTDRTRERVLPSGRWIVSGVCIFLAVITWLVFGQTLSHDFINF